MQETVGIVVNPTSGRGRSPALADQTMVALRSAGFEVRSMLSQRVYAVGHIEEFLTPCTALVVFGGDGTLQPFLQSIAQRDLPLYVAPTGNQSLFSRLFAMSAEPRAIVSTLQSAGTSKHFLGAVGAHRFFHMVSVGFDSAVIETISKQRIGTVSNLSYVWPSLRTLVRYRAPTISVRVDGEMFVTNATGYLIIANSPAYACNLNPGAGADSSVNLLNIRFFPGYTELYRPLLGLITRNSVSLDGCGTTTGNQIEVDVHHPGDHPIQADGELIGYGSFRAEIKGTIRVYQSYSFSSSAFGAVSNPGIGSK